MGILAICEKVDQKYVNLNDSYLVKASLKQRAPPLLILEPAARVLELTGQLAPKVDHVLNVHLESVTTSIIVKI